MINNKITSTKYEKSRAFPVVTGHLWIYPSPWVCLDKCHMSDRTGEFQWDLDLEVWGRGECYQMFYNNICSWLMVLLKIINNEINWYCERSLSSISQLYKCWICIKFMVLHESLLNTIKGLHFCNNMQIDHLICLQPYQNKIPTGHLGSSK